MANTAVPSIQFTETGLVLPQESAILAGALSDMNAAFGGKLNPALNTPQGQLASSLAAVVSDNNDQFAEYVNQVDPDTNDGFMQDAIARIYFLNRSPGASTVAQCLCVGALGTVIPVGAQAQDTSGNLYLCTQAGTIPVGGSITLSFANAVVGPIACPANTLNQIYQAIPGWDTINNPSDGVVGSNIETAAEFRVRRDQSVALNAHGSLPSIYAAVFDVAGVIDVYATENVTDSPIVVGSTNYTLLPHSVYVAATGGLASAVAQAIWTKKDLGADMNGNTTVVVTDPSGYSFPQPTYNITFEVPPAITYDFIVNIKNSAALPSTIVADVTAAIAAQFNGVVGALLPNGVTAQTSGVRVRIGSLLLAAGFYGPVATCEGSGVPVQVLSILLGNTFTGLGTLVGGTSTLTITTASTGLLTASSAVSGTGIPSGTTIVRQLTGSGTGGTGTYQMSANASTTESSPEAITGAGSTAQQIGIDQQPTLGTVVVNLV
jgi:uncharacterized phage protein gp47/JayE